MKDTNNRELEKCECVSSVMNITHIMNMETQIIGAMGILQVIDDGVFVCICSVYLDIFKKIYHMHPSMTFIFHKKIISNILLQSLIIDLIHTFVYWKKNIKKAKLH